MKRRTFLGKMGVGAALLGAGGFPVKALAGLSGTVRLTILHTNDLHCRMGEDGNLSPVIGLTETLAEQIARVKAEEANVLLLDAGDVREGASADLGVIYRRMSELGYDAAGLGNRDLGDSLNLLIEQCSHANFSLLSANYEFQDAGLSLKIQPYQVLTRGSLRIGVFGVGLDLNKLKDNRLCQDVHCLDPIASASRYAAILRQEEGCDYVICLSHLGYQYPDDTVSDMVLARQTRGIDLILGGHTHTFMDAPEVVQNIDNEPVLIHHAAWGGLLLGRIDLDIEPGGGFALAGGGALPAGAAV